MPSLFDFVQDLQNHFVLTSLFVNLIYDKRESGHVLGKAFPLFSVEFYILCAKVVGLNIRP